MKTATRYALLACLLILVTATLNPRTASGCSTFMLNKGSELIFGHNLNEGDIGVPRLMFVNKRGVFKLGRTWSESITAERTSPSSYSWISRYGSVTFNVFGRDLPDGA